MKTFSSLQLFSSQLIPKTRPEIELLLCCARTQIDLITKKRIQTLVKQEIDWSYLIKTSAHHGVMPLLYYSLNAICPEDVPTAIFSQLRNFFHRNAQHNLSLAKELMDLLNLFKEHNISAIPYKGPVLALLLYKNLALRQISDLDIIVHKKDILKIKELLMSEDYQPLLILERNNEYLSEYGITDELESEFLRSPSQFNYKFKPNKDKIAFLEIHWTLAGQESFLSMDSNWWWNSVHSVSFANTTILSFSPENLLLILCINAMKDQWRSLKGVCDVAELLQLHPKMNWEFVFKQASEIRIERILLLGLFLAQNLFKSEIPNSVLQRIKTDPVSKLYGEKVCQQMFAGTENLQGILENFLFRLLREPSLQKMTSKGYLVGQFCRLVMTPTEEDISYLSLPKSLSFLYYLVRPIRLAQKHGSL